MRQRQSSKGSEALRPATDNVGVQIVGGARGGDCVGLVIEVGRLRADGEDLFRYLRGVHLGEAFFHLRFVRARAFVALDAGAGGAETFHHV